MNLTPPKRVKAWSDTPLRPEVFPVMRHTRPESCSPPHGRLKCEPTTGETHQSRDLVDSVFSFVMYKRKHETLYWGAFMPYLYFLGGPSYPHSPTHSSVPPTHTHTHTHATSTKIHCSLCEKDLFKIPNETVKEMGGKKPEKETKEKIPVWLPSHQPSMIWKPTVFWCPRTPKTS